MGRKAPDRIAVVNLPTARVVPGNALLSSWRHLGIRRRAAELGGSLVRPLAPALRTMAMYFVGLFPVFAAAGLAVVLAWLITYHGGP